MPKHINLPVTETELDVVIMCLENEKERLEYQNKEDEHERLAGLEFAMDVNEVLNRFNAIRGEV